MEYDIQIPQSATSDKTSFAYISAIERYPVILTGAIDDVHKTVSETNDEAKRNEGKIIISELAKLKYEIQHDRELVPLPDDGRADVAGYNRELEQLQAKGNRQWFNMPWIYVECYLYRRIASLFALTEHWKTYDVFARQKISTFRSSRPAVIELAERYHVLITQMKDKDNKSEEEIDAAEKILFIEMSEICLWGNATDLSLLTTLTYEDIQKLQGSKARKESEKNILVNDLEEAYSVLKKAQKEGKKERRVDIVLDNSGFELFVDLILAGFLLSSGLATNIVLHPKSIPWYVSDVLPSDFAALLNALATAQDFYSTPSEDEKLSGKLPNPLTEKEVKELAFLFQEWAGFHAEGQLTIRPNDFWTEGGSFWRLPKTATELYEDLKESEIVIFKGDLNYRKLVADGVWDPTTPFTTAIGPLGPGSGVNILSLRTCKADVVVGLKPGQDEELKATPGGGGDSGARKWAWSGKWAVVSFSGGK